jgi:hypothetical protein
MGYREKTIEEFDKDVSSLLQFSSRSNAKGTFTMFESADKSVDAVIISKNKAREPEERLEVIGVYKTSDLASFPLIFTDNDLAQYYFFPAKETGGDVIYDIRRFVTFYNGKIMNATYTVSGGKEIDPPEEESEPGFFGKLFTKSKEKKKAKAKYKRIRVTITAANVEVDSRSIWYQIREYNSEIPKVDSDADEPQVFSNKLRLVKYPVPPFVPKKDEKDETMYISEFFVFTKPNEFIILDSNKERVILTEEKEAEKTQGGVAAAPPPPPPPPPAERYPIYCTNYSCLSPVNLAERYVKLSPPADVLKAISDFNIKKEMPYGSTKTKVSSIYDVDDDDDDETEEITETAAADPQKKENEARILSEFSRSLPPHFQGLYENNSEICELVCRILFDDVVSVDNLKKALKVVFYYSSALCIKRKKRDGVDTFENIDKTEDIHIPKLNHTNFFAPEEAVKISGNKDRYGNSVSEYYCPHCFDPSEKKPLIRDHGKNETVFISLLGATSSGKTVYLAQTMFSYFKNSVNINRDLDAGWDDETENYLKEIKETLSRGDQVKSNHGRADIKQLTYFLTLGGVTKNIVIYDIPGEMLFEEDATNRKEILKKIYDRANIVLFIFPVEQAEHSAIIRPEGVPTFRKIIDKIKTDIFSGTSDSPYGSTLPAGNTAFILSKVDKLRPDYLGKDIKKQYFTTAGNIVEKITALEGIETNLDVFTATGADKAAKIADVLNREDEYTRKFFYDVLSSEYVAIKNNFPIDAKFFSYGTPDGDPLNKNKNIHPIRPFNSIQWIIDRIFENNR